MGIRCSDLPIESAGRVRIERTASCRDGHSLQTSRETTFNFERGQRRTSGQLGDSKSVFLRLSFWLIMIFFKIECTQIFFDQNENRFTSDTDYMILQESSETIRLSGNVDVSSLVTGVVACVLGHEDEDGNSFAVEEICFAGPSVQPIQRIVQNEEPKYVMLVSGLGFSLNASEELVEAREMLFDLLTGRNDNEMNRKAARIVKLIVAGNCIGKNVRQTEANLIAKNGRQWSNRNNTAYTAPVVRQIDQWLFELGKHIEIDVLPGETDPASVMMPQQAFHPAILPKCSQLQSIRCTTNPYGSIIDRTQFLGTAGQPVNSIRVYSEIDDSIQIMCRQLEWSHLAPLAPDCLHSYPFKDKDPFIIESSPHVYFSGNQPNFNTMMFDQNGIQTRLLSLPEFETSFIAVLLDLNSLDVEICSFA